jgi:hypothetical protein
MDKPDQREFEVETLEFEFIGSMTVTDICAESNHFLCVLLKECGRQEHNP